jgi:hypothetical protein
VDRALAEVFERPEFAPPPPSPIGEWLAGVWDSVRRWIAGAFAGVDLTPGGQRLLFWMVVALLAVAALALLVRVVRLAAAWWARRGERERRTPGTSSATATSAEDWDARARDAAAGGRWRDAALALYHALLLRLAARGAVRVDAAKTPGDYRRETRGDETAAAALDAFLRPFEPVAFGGRPLDAEGYARLRATVAQAGANG